MRVRRIASVVALAWIFAASPAAASDDPNPAGATAHPEIGPAPWPIVRAPLDRGALDVVIVAPAQAKGMHGLRRVAAYIDARVGALRFHTAPGVQCADYPSASLCITAVVGNFGDTRWAGWVDVLAAPNPHFRTITLNTYYPWWGRGQSMAGHELMHALGMMHHLEPGIVGAGWPAYPSVDELRALRAAY